MISNNTGSIRTTEFTDRSVADSCLLGSLPLGTGVSGVTAGRPESAASLLGLGTRERGGRPIQAPAAAAAQAKPYAFAVTGAESWMSKQYHMMWAFRGLEPWRDPA